MQKNSVNCFHFASVWVCYYFDLSICFVRFWPYTLELFQLFHFTIKDLPTINLLIEQCCLRNYDILLGHHWRKRSLSDEGPTIFLVMNDVYLILIDFLDLLTEFFYGSCWRNIEWSLDNFSLYFLSWLSFQHFPLLWLSSLFSFYLGWFFKFLSEFDKTFFCEKYQHCLNLQWIFRHEQSFFEYVFYDYCQDGNQIIRLHCCQFDFTWWDNHRVIERQMSIWDLNIWIFPYVSFEGTFFVQDLWICINQFFNLNRIWEFSFVKHTGDYWDNDHMFLIAVWLQSQNKLTLVFGKLLLISILLMFCLFYIILFIFLVYIQNII